MVASLANNVLKTTERPTEPFHIAICLTHTFDYMLSQFVDLLISLQTKYSHTILRSNQLPIDLNRNTLTKLSLEMPAVTHLLFIDTDIIPKRRDFLDVMVDYDLPIVGLLCTKKVPPYEPVIIKMDAPADQVTNGFWTGHPKGLVEVDATGTGCLLVKKEVFLSMKEPFFKFLSSYEDGLHQSEDIYFINGAREKGYKVYVDTVNTCMHWGVYGYGVHNQLPFNQPK